MANSVVSRRWRSQKIDGFDLSPPDDEQVHVLAVDDSLVDRKVIERLLKISSCKGSSLDFAFLFRSWSSKLIDVVQ